MINPITSKFQVVDAPDSSLLSVFTFGEVKAKPNKDRVCASAVVLSAKKAAPLYYYI